MTDSDVATVVICSLWRGRGQRRQSGWRECCLGVLPRAVGQARRKARKLMTTSGAKS